MSNNANTKPAYVAVEKPCGYFSVEPMPTTKELSEFYSKIYYQDSASTTYQSSYTDEEIAQKKLRAELLLYSIKAQLTEDQRSFLEVGCGEGFLLSAAVAHDFEVEGIDFSIHGIHEFHPELVNRVVVGDAFELLDEFIIENKSIDVCVLQNVLEHVIDPVSLLKRIKNLIGSSGFLAITVPNDYSVMQNKLIESGFINEEYWFLPPQHLHYFNVDTLSKFVNENGFEVIDTYGDFPIEMFLFHENSNYAVDSNKGKAAHNARVKIDLLLAQNGMKSYYEFCQALSACGVGRTVTVILKSTSINVK